MIENKDKIISVKITDSEFSELSKIADRNARSVSSTVRLLIINMICGNISVSSCVTQIDNYKS